MVELIPYDQEIEDYIKMVFKYFNGKINIVNTATLTIDWTQRYSSYIAAFSILPNRVFINPLVVARYCPAKEYLRFQIVEYIIHELYHTDQIIQYKKLDDKAYVNNIESAVEKQVALYYKMHADSIQRDLGVYMDDSCFKYFEEVLKVNNQYTHPYERRTPADHLWMLVDQYTDPNFDSIQMRNMIHYAIDNNYQINFIINGKEIELEEYLFRGPKSLMSVNYYLQDAYDGIIHKATADIEQYDEPNMLIIRINSLQKHVMCNIITQERRLS